MMGGRLQSLLHTLETWFFQAKNTATDPNEVLQSLPPEMTHQLQHRLTTLPLPPAHIQTVQTGLEEAIAHWQEFVEAENTLVVLGSSVEPIAPILTASVQGWQSEVRVALPLPDEPRSPDPLAIPSQLYNALDPERKEPTDADARPEAVEVSPSERLKERQTVVVIPSLERYFLRCIQGWEGIEYLQNLALRDRSRFWVFGCGYWAWAFLDRVCQISAYLEQRHPLPPLDDAALQDWLEPLVQSVLQRHPPESEAEPSVSASYWKALASLSGGNSTTAAHLWVTSLRVRADDLPAEAGARSPLAAFEQGELPLHLVKPVLPSLTSLEALDRYLLHALLVHGGLTRSHLANSLGEDGQVVRSRVQVLKRAGVIWERQGLLQVHPAHYPKLRSELSNNNFLVGEA